MVDVLATIADDLSHTPEPALRQRLEGWYKATHRRMHKVYKAYRPGSFKSVEFERHRYPGITPADLAQRLARFQQVLGDDTQLHLDQIHDKVFRISA
jgi:hypothetical protein